MHRISSRYCIPVNKCRKWFVRRGVKIRGSSFTVINATQSSGALSPQFAAKFSKCVVDEIERRRARGAILYHLPYHIQIEMLKRTHDMMWLRSKFVEELAAELKLPIRAVNSWLLSRAKKNRTCDISNLTTFKQNMLREEMEKSLDFDVDRALMLSYVLDIPVAFLQKSFNGRRTELGLPQVDVMNKLKTRADSESNINENVAVVPKLEKEKDRKMSIVLTPCNLQLIAPSLARSLSSSRASKSVSRGKKNHFHPPQTTTTLFREYKKSKKMTPERAHQIASETGLEPLKVMKPPRLVFLRHWPASFQ